MAAGDVHRFSRHSGNLVLAGDLIPDQDNLRNLGSSTKEFKDLRIDGIAYIDGMEGFHAETLHSFFPNTGSTEVVATARVYVNPIVVPVDLYVDAVIIHLGDPVAGNVIVGIYADNTDTPVGGAVIIESASTAKTGTNRQMEVAITETLLTKGLYWLAIESDEATTILQKSSGYWCAGGTLKSHTYERAGGYGALTDPCPATTTDSVSLIVDLRVSKVV